MGYFRRGRISGFVDCSGLQSEGHTINVWHRKIAIETREAVKSFAPERTGRLKRGIKAYGPSRKLGRNVNYAEAEIRVSARDAKSNQRNYAMFVHEGTLAAGFAGRIVGKSGWTKLSDSGGSYSEWTGKSKTTNRSQPLYTPISGGKNRKGKFFPTTRATRNVGFPHVMRGPVRGQAPNPFILNGLAEVAVAHRWRAGRIDRRGVFD